MLRATFINNNAVEISWKKHPLAKHYNLYKQHDKNTSVLIQKHFSDTVYMDHLVSLTAPLHYYVTATDSCGNISAASQIAKPIILQADNIENKYILISGTAYEKWGNGVWEYVLEMKYEKDSFFDVSNSTQINYTDSIRHAGHLLQQCYRLKAIENGGNKQVSYSNTACADHLPQLFIPNAFSPNGDSLNERFVIHTIGIKEYTIAIYNRWGELVFSGNRYNAVWDGKFKGEPCPEGNYLYKLHARSRTGENFIRNGYIKLLR
ncbi:MAG: T9SS type B sorting domain-containing protein [Bacteroidia bacterium]